MRARSDRIFTEIEKSSLDAVDAIVLMNGGSTSSDNTFKYVSAVTRGGYEGCAAVLRPDERPTLVVSALEEESAATAPDCDVAAFASQKARGELLTNLLGRAKRIGVNATGILLAHAKLLEKLCPDAELVDVSDAISSARLVKDEREIELIRRACHLTSDIAAEIPSMLRAGMTELDLSAEIANAIHRGGGKVAFDTIVCFGANGSEPHYSPQDVKLQEGDMILVDFGAQLADYCSDITRMYLFGSSSPKQREMFDVVRKAQLSALESTQIGSVGKDIHQKAVEIIDSSPYAGRFIHGLGHSIGLDVHDGPGLNASSKITMEAGMIMTIEPGVYVPGVGGVRIEDTVLIKEGGPEILTPVTKDLVEVPA